MNDKINLNDLILKSYMETIILKAQIKLILSTLKDKNPELFQDFTQILRASLIETIENDSIVKNHFDESQIRELISEIN